MHMDPEGALLRQRRDCGAQAFEQGWLVHRDTEARREFGHPQPHAPQPIGTPGVGKALELLDRIAEHCAQPVRGR